MERSICAAAQLRPGSSASASPSACRRDRLHPRMHADRRRRFTVRRCSAGIAARCPIAFCSREARCPHKAGTHQGMLLEDGAAVRELQGEELQRWQASRGALEALDLSEEEAERVMKRAFGWTTQAWWRDSKVCEVPAQGQVRRQSWPRRCCALALCSGTVLLCSGTALLCSGTALLCSGTALLCSGTALLCSGTALGCPA